MLLPAQTPLPRNQSLSFENPLPSLMGGGSDDHHSFDYFGQIRVLWSKLENFRGQNGQSNFDHDNLCTSRFFLSKFVEIDEISVNFDHLTMTIF
jgi:hypothetical protein